MVVCCSPSLLVFFFFFFHMWHSNSENASLDNNWPGHAVASLSIIRAGQQWDICFGKISSGIKDGWMRGGRAVIVLCSAHVCI